MRLVCRSSWWVLISFFWGIFFLIFLLLQDDHRAFRRQLEDKRPIIENNLLSGKQYLENEALLSDTSDTEGKSLLWFSLPITSKRSFFFPFQPSTADSWTTHRTTNWPEVLNEKFQSCPNSGTTWLIDRIIGSTGWTNTWRWVSEENHLKFERPMAIYDIISVCTASWTFLEKCIKCQIIVIAVWRARCKWFCLFNVSLHL